MQDAYVGDVGDFGKYGLLNEIHRKSDGKIRLGVNWYYVIEEEKKTGNVRYTDYLCDNNKNSTKYRDCFPGLYDQLRSIVKSNRRNIREIEKGSVLPNETTFYSEPLPHSSAAPTERKEARRNWLDQSLKELDMTDIVFLDPDNGIQTERIKETQKKARKYAFIHEIQAYYESGKSLIVYNHRDRTEQSEYRRKLLSAANFLKPWDEIRALEFQRLSVRHYLFLIRKEHNDLIARTIGTLTREQPCNFLFKEYPLS
ncbi:MAG: hypothetical protein ACETVW_00050 [Dehalococcoidia bacterium]